MPPRASGTRGRLLLRADGKQMDRRAATRVVVRLAKKAGITKHISPHSLRHAVTACRDAGVPLRDVQIAARHSDPRMTTRYDRARGNLNRHANDIVVGLIDGSGERQPRPPSCSVRDGRQMDRRAATRFVMRPLHEAAIKTSPPRSFVMWHLCYIFAHDEGCIARLEKPHGRSVTSGV
jgi:hypothetical protein